jgi:hypothetical protein
MLPDFPRVKAHLQSQLLRWVQAQVPVIAPILGQIRHYHQHEGRASLLARDDRSVAEMTFERKGFELVLDREGMKVTDMPGVYRKMAALAEDMAREQSTMLFAGVSKAVEEVGNTVSTGGVFEPHHLLEGIDKMQMEFDPASGEPVGQSFVMHPDTAAKLIPRMKEWEKDPQFVAEHARLLDKKRQEWRDRENRRKLVD